MTDAVPLPTISILNMRHCEFLSNRRVVLQANILNATAGFASIEFPADDVAWINDLFIQPEWRRRGLARMLVQAAASWVAHHDPGITCINAGVDRNNLGSLALFRSEGFRHVYTYPDSDTLLMWRDVPIRPACGG